MPVITPNPQDQQKYFMHKVYDSGRKFISSWAKDVSNVPEFTWTKSGGMGNMIIKLARSFSDFGDGYDVKIGNRIKTVIHDKDKKDGKQIYSGSITGYSPKFDENGVQYIEVEVTSNSTTLRDTLLKNGSNTTVSYSKQKTSAIIKDLVSKYNGVITTSDRYVQDSGDSVSYTFKFVDYLEAINTTSDLAASYWHWYIDGNDTLYFRRTNLDVVQHKLVMGEHVKQVDSMRRNSGSMYNVVYFVGGGDPPLYRKFTRPGSINEYGRHEYKMVDERVTLPETAQAMATKFLDENDHPIPTIEATIIDDSVDNTKGYDIESLSPGDSCQVINPSVGYEQSRLYSDDLRLGNFYLDISYLDFDPKYLLGQPMQIQSIEYRFYEAKLVLSLSEQPATVVGELADIRELVDKKISNTVQEISDLSPLSGWIPLDFDLTYSSSDSPSYEATCQSDRTDYFSPGMKFKVTDNGSEKYFFLTKRTYSSISDLTTFTFYGGTDYTLSGGALSSLYFSTDKAPEGFDLNPDKWTVTLYSNLANYATPGAGIWRNLVDFATSLPVIIVTPIGAWRVIYSSEGSLSLTAASNFIEMSFALSAESSIASESELVSRSSILENDSSVFSLAVTMHKEFGISVGLKTNYYFIGTAGSGIMNADTIAVAFLSIKFICIYI